MTDKITEHFLKWEDGRTQFIKTIFNEKKAKP